MNGILFLFFSLYILSECFEYWLEFLNLRHLEREGSNIPPEFQGHIDGDLLKKTRDYIIENSRFGFFSSVFNNIIVILFIFCGLLNIYNSWLLSFNFSFISSGILFFLLISLAGTLLSTPFSLYSTFKIENKYGFNTTTKGLWIGDFIKSLIISTILMSLLLAAGLWLIQWSHDFWWLWVWGFFLVFSIFMMYISPYVIEPLFNKFTPIEEESLEEGIRTVMSKAGIKVSRVFKMDASKRSKHTNAYFTGIGKVKRIVLYDTLIESMTREEILSVLAHEAGHWKKKHLLKHMIVFESISLVVIYVSFHILKSDFLLDIFNIEQATLFAKLVVLGFIGGIVFFPFTPLFNHFSRKNENEADRYSYEITGDRESMISALVKLSKDNLSNLSPHPLYSKFHYSHPPVLERIKNIRSLDAVVS